MTLQVIHDHGLILIQLFLSRAAQEAFLDPARYVKQSLSKRRKHKID